MSRFLNVLSMITFVGSASLANAQEMPPRTVVGIDVSGTSTFLVDQTSADAVGGFVQNYIAALGDPHALSLVSVGDAGMARRIIDIRATVTASRASSAKKLASQFGGYVRSLPGLVERGDIAAQETTSLIDFFHSLEPACASGNATVIVFSDGLEWSSSVDGRAFAAGKVTLPKPESAFLAGCHVKLLGVGQVKNALDSNGLAERLIPQWRAFLSAAGAEPVTVIGGGFSF